MALSLLHCGIVTMWHNGLVQCSIMALSLWDCRYGIVIMALSLWQCGIVALWLCGIVALWHCHRDIMALWPWHYVYLLATPVAKMYKYKTESKIKHLIKNGLTYCGRASVTYR